MLFIVWYLSIQHTPFISFPISRLNEHLLTTERHERTVNFRYFCVCSEFGTLLCTRKICDASGTKDETFLANVNISNSIFAEKKTKNAEWAYAKRHNTHVNCSTHTHDQDLINYNLNCFRFFVQAHISTGTTNNKQTESDGKNFGVWQFVETRTINNSTFNIHV